MPKPKFSSYDDRRRAALLMYNGIGREEALKPDEIADKLGVTTTTVVNYLKDDSPLSNAMRARMEDVAEQELRILIDDLQSRLSKLRSIEEELYDSVEVTVTGYETETVRGSLEQYKTDNYQLDVEDHNMEQDIPVPSEWKEVPQFDRLQAVWEEQRKTQDQLANLLGLNQPEEIEVKGEVTERKIWDLGTQDDGLPEQEIEPIDVSDPEDGADDEPPA